MLRERWERDPASRLFLQLAEEYRRDGQPAEAVKVLETGLGHHPGYLAARVALGRCRLETGDAAGAAEALERVIAADPTQLVANKLLIATYLRLDRTSEARDRLDLYVLLNEADPEIDGLERQLMAAEAAAGPATLPDLPTAYGELVEIARRPGGGEAPPVEEAFQLPAAEPLAFAPRLPAPLDLEALPLPVSARRRVDPAALPPPFPSLASPRFRSGAAPLAALAAAGIFRWQAAAVAPALEAEEPRLLAPAAAEPLELDLEVEEAAAPPPETRWWEAVQPEPSPAAVEPPPEPAPELEIETEVAPELALEIAPAEPAAAADETAARPWWQLSQTQAPAAIAPPEPVPPPVPEVPEPESWEPLPSERAEPSYREAEPLGAVEPPLGFEPEPIAATLPEPTAEIAAPAFETARADAGSEPAPGEATTTLAELYLQQGHLEEASAAFAAVLARRPGDPAAEAGLVRIAERRSLPLGAADLLASDEAPAGLTGRKVLLLQRYLQRIREGAKRHVP
jgi:tetratricopeptide (TPR) repeat protein